MKKIILIPCLALLLGIIACSTDFDINAPAKDITVVFGLLDPGDSAHYVKITKAFIGNQDAIVMAQDPANSSYGTALNVTVEEYTNGSLTHTYGCTPTIIHNKEAGTFYYPDQEVYVFTDPISAYSSYKLIIENKESGKIVTAETGLINDFSIVQPYYNAFATLHEISFVSPNGQYINNSETKWKSAKNGRLYEPAFRFNYREVDLTTLDTVDKHVDWKLNSVKSQNLDGGEELTMTYSAESFYSYIGSSISVDGNKKRIIGPVDYIISVGGEDLSTYIDLNRPSNTIIQERPAYTNISNGIGIFSCRFNKSRSYTLSAFSVEKLIHGDYTKDLGFE
jgi:hypothetical protein